MTILKELKRNPIRIYDNYIEGNDHSEYLDGDNGNNHLWGKGGDDVLDGGGGNDTLWGEEGADSLDGGSGNDTAVYFGSDAGVEVNLMTGKGRGGEAEGDRLFNIENLKGCRHDDRLIGNADNNTLMGIGGHDVLKGGAGDDHLHSREGRDRLYGGSGRDMLLGGGNADILDGGSGNDYASYNNSDAGVEVNLVTGKGKKGHAEGDHLANIENVEGSLYDDSLVGNKGNNTLEGGGGNDVLKGNDGRDRLEGGNGKDHLKGDSGSDFLWGGADADILDGGSGNDYAGYGFSSDGVEVNLVTGEGKGGHAEGDRLTNIENVVGSWYNDTLVGNGGNNILVGGKSGQDHLYGGDGDDTLWGGTGNDTFWSGPGNDKVFGGYDVDRVYFSQKDGHDSLKNVEYLYFEGSFSSDRVWFNQQGSNLKISFIGQESDSIIVADWYVDKDLRLNSINILGEKKLTILPDQVDRLVIEMARYEKKPNHSISSTTHPDLYSLVKSSWKSP